ncbi:MAG: A/G-specific adenine glycosylase [Acidobacteriia bacterium]|nr:A/G-specific adenine glycosylase [Terriglobia bacterium]
MNDSIFKEKAKHLSLPLDSRQRMEDSQEVFISTTPEEKLIHPREIKDLRRKLLSWYRHNCRDLPWRRISDSYPIWISEIMLQQTQVQTVIPYFIRFMNSYPTIIDLANANTQSLLNHWAGLGYYSRAKNLKKAAKIIIKIHEGCLPNTYQDLIQLPGIGHYTASAILSIAFKKPYIALDGNLIRVLSRLFKLKGDITKTLFQRSLSRYGQQLIDELQPGEFNQALMDLGSSICLPRKPRCLVCPWESRCRSKRAGMQEKIPEKKKNLKVSVSNEFAVVIIHRGRTLIRKRSHSRLLQDMWEFPTGQIDQEESEDFLEKRIWSEFGLKISSPNLLTNLKHSITNRAINLQIYRANLKSPKVFDRSRITGKWIFISQIKKYPLTAATSKIVDLLRESSC